MRKSILAAAGAGTVLFLSVAAGVAYAAPQAPAARQQVRQAGQGSPNGDTTVTLTVGQGDLTIDVPSTATLSTGTGLAGSTISGNLGDVAVHDERAQRGASWTVNVSSTDFTFDNAGTTETIPASGATYSTGAFTLVSGGVTKPNPTSFTLNSGGSFQATGTLGNNVVRWNPSISVNIPATAIAGTYTATVTHSVS